MGGATWKIIEMKKNVFFPTGNDISQLFKVSTKKFKKKRLIAHTLLLDIHWKSFVFEIDRSKINPSVVPDSGTLMKSKLTLVNLHFHHSLLNYLSNRLIHSLGKLSSTGMYPESV